MSDAEEDMITTISIKVAAAQSSYLEPGKWNALALRPDQICLGTYDTEDEAIARAEHYTDLVLKTLRQSRRLNKELDHPHP